MELYVSTCSIKPRVILIDSLRELANSKPLFVLLMLMLEILDHMYRAYLLNNPFFLNLWNVKFCSGEQCNPWASTACIRYEKPISQDFISLIRKRFDMGFLFYK